MSTKSYRSLCEEDAADAATKLQLMAQSKLAPARELEPAVELLTELTVLQKFQAAVLVCRNMDDAIKISPAILAEVLELKVPIPHYFFGSVRAIYTDCGWTARMTWSELALEIGQAARRARREELLKLSCAIRHVPSPTPQVSDLQTTYRNGGKSLEVADQNDVTA